MNWRGGAEEAPIALVGKGVTFDTGGISLKPAKGMEDMKFDMGGAAAVTGTMMALAERQVETQCCRHHRPCREYAGWQCSASR